MMHRSAPTFDLGIPDVDREARLAWLDGLTTAVRHDWLRLALRFAEDGCDDEDLRDWAAAYRDWLTDRLAVAVEQAVTVAETRP